MHYRRNYHIKLFVIAITIILNQVMLIASNSCFAQEASQSTIHPSVAYSAVKLDDDFGRHYQLSRHYFSRADLTLAELEIEQAIALKPQVKFAHRYYCLIAALRGNIFRALAEFMMAFGLGQAIPLNSSELTQLNVECAKMHYRKGLSYETQRRYPRAIFEMQLAHYYQPQNLQIMRSLAFNQGKGGLFEEAEKLYQDSFKTNAPESVEDAYAHADYAYLLAADHKRDEAIDQLSKATQIVPNSAALHIDLSLFLEAAGNLPRATQEMQIAIKTAPEFAMHNLQSTEAVAHVNQSPDWNLYHPAKTRPTYASLWTHLGRLLDKQNKISSARKAYTRALILDGQNELVKIRLRELQKQPPVQYTSSAATKDMEAETRSII